MIVKKSKNFVVLILVLNVGVSALFAQECDCLQNLEFLESNVEENQASYQHQVIEQNRLNFYNSFKKEINAKAKQINLKKDCIALVSIYLSFFRDEHCFIRYADQHQASPNVKIKARRGEKNSVNTMMESVWYFQDGSFSIKLIPEKTTLGEWVAVLNENASKNWKEGQLKIEFFKDSEGYQKCVYWSMNLIPKTHPVNLTDSVLTIGRHLHFYKKKPVPNDAEMNTSLLHFQSLSAETNYLRISSFDLTLKKSIDSLLELHHAEIVSKKNLILDIRNNGGGGFAAFESLLPYTMDTTVLESPYEGSVWVSKQNFEYYDQIKYEFSETIEDSTNELNYINWLASYRGYFSPVAPSIDTIEIYRDAPTQIALLINRNTASSAEGFILQAKKSKKVKIFGENSAGAVSYGDWRPLALPALNIWVAITTKKMVFKMNEDFEGIGIKPEYYLPSNHENEWIMLVKQQLEE